MQKFVKILLVAALCQFGNAAVAADHSDNALVRMFAWWNGAIKDPNGFTEAGFRQHFTEDGAIIINGRERVRGIKPLVEHFKRIQQNTEYVEIVLPFEEGFESGDRIFTYHLIRARANGQDSVSHIMGYAIVEDGKIALVDFLSYEPPTDDASTSEAEH